jgi:TetR/AcrR family transcriptional regulator
MSPARRIGVQAPSTRDQILVAAEAVFAEKSFAAARLEDVAERVGIRRASMVYYFRDKQQLYDAVLTAVFGGLLARLHDAVNAAGAIGERIEAAVTAWVNYVGERPTIARLLLREVSDATAARQPAVVAHARPILVAMEALIREGQKKGLLQPLDPIHLASTIAGATVFFVAATPLLGADWPHDPLSQEQFAAHRMEVLRITRRLLGLHGPRPTRRGRRRVSVRKARGPERVAR